MSYRDHWYAHLTEVECEALVRERQREDAYFRALYARPRRRQIAGDLDGVDAGLFGPSVDERRALEEDWRTLER